VRGTGDERRFFEIQEARRVLTRSAATLQHQTKAKEKGEEEKEDEEEGDEKENEREDEENEKSQEEVIEFSSDDEDPDAEDSDSADQDEMAYINGILNGGQAPNRWFFPTPAAPLARGGRQGRGNVSNRGGRARGRVRHTRRPSSSFPFFIRNVNNSNNYISEGKRGGDGAGPGAGSKQRGWKRPRENFSKRAPPATSSARLVFHGGRGAPILLPSTFPFPHFQVQQQQQQLQQHQVPAALLFAPEAVREQQLRLVWCAPAERERVCQQMRASNIELRVQPTLVDLAVGCAQKVVEYHADRLCPACLGVGVVSLQHPATAPESSSKKNKNQQRITYAGASIGGSSSSTSGAPVTNHVNLEGEFFADLTARIEIACQMKMLCNQCLGQGGCPNCRGTGLVFFLNQAILPFRTPQPQQAPPASDPAAAAAAAAAPGLLSEWLRCAACDGVGLLSGLPCTATISIPPGVPVGSSSRYASITLDGHGHLLFWNVPSTDLVCHLELEAVRHVVSVAAPLLTPSLVQWEWELRGNGPDLYLHVPISLDEALHGLRFDIERFDGTRIHLETTSTLLLEHAVSFYRAGYEPYAHLVDSLKSQSAAAAAAAASKGNERQRNSFSTEPKYFLLEGEGLGIVAPASSNATDITTATNNDSNKNSSSTKTGGATRGNLLLAFHLILDAPAQLRDPGIRFYSASSFLPPNKAGQENNAEDEHDDDDHVKKVEQKQDVPAADSITHAETKIEESEKKTALKETIAGFSSCS
jgi:DnaJ-class molecular chaperone